MLINYSHHRIWIWFTLACFLGACCLYAGLCLGPAPEVPGLGILGWGLFSLGILLFLARVWVPSPALARLAFFPALVASLGGFSALGFHYGILWSQPEGVKANSVAGMWFGILGSACMVFAGLLSGLRRVPSWWWLGKRSTWLKGHIWLGLLSGPLILFHSGFHWGGALEVVLWILLALVIVSGIVGVVLQQVLPHLLTTRLYSEVPYEQIPHLCGLLRQKGDMLVGSAWRTAPAGGATEGELCQVYDQVIRPFFQPDYDPGSPLARVSQAESIFQNMRALPGVEKWHVQLQDLETLCHDRRQMGEQERLHVWLHWWLLAHIPLSVALLGLGAIHAVVSVYY